jgi:hypothetical protein
MICLAIETKESQIWSIKPSLSGDELLLESRNANNMKMFFGITDLQPGSELMWIEPPASWWLTPVAFCDNAVLCYKRSMNDLPECESVLLYAFSQNSIIWEETGAKIMAYDREEIKLSCVGTTEGLFEKRKAWVEKGAQQGLAKNKPASQMGLPAVYLEGSGHFDTCYRYICQKLNIKPVGQIEYIEEKNMISLSFYVRSKHGMSNRLLLLDKNNGNLIWEDEIAGNLKAYADHSFAVWKDMLLYVKDKKQLLGIKLGA